MTWQRSLVFFFVALLTVGCGKMFGPMHDRMDSTISKIDKTNDSMTQMQELMKIANRTMSDVHLDQTLKGVGDVFLNKDYSENVRIRAIQIFLTKADRTKVVWQYIGAPLPILADTDFPIYRYSFKDADGTLLFDFRNVTLIHDKAVVHEIKDKRNRIVYRRILKPVNDDLYRVLCLATEHGIDVVMLSYKAAKTDEDKALARDQAYLLLHFGASVLGAARVSTESVEVKTDDVVQRIETKITSDFFVQAKTKFVQPKEYRAHMANRFREMLEAVNIREQLPALKALAENRMGLTKDDWNYPLD